jgi:hypothetical protein
MAVGVVSRRHERMGAWRVSCTDTFFINLVEALVGMLEYQRFVCNGYQKKDSDAFSSSVE